MSAYNAVNGEWCGESRTLLTEHPARPVGLRRLRDQRLDLRAARRRHIGERRPRRRDARADGPLRAPRRRPSTPGAVDGRRHRRERSTHTVAAMLRHATDPDRDRSPVGDDVLAQPSHRALAREAAAKAIVLLRNEPVDGTPLLPARRRDRSTGSRCSVGWPTSGTSATAARATCTRPTRRDPPGRAREPPCPTPRCSTPMAPTSTRRPRWRHRPTSPIVVVGLHPRRRGRVHRRVGLVPPRRRCMPAADEPDGGGQPSRPASPTTTCPAPDTIPGSDALGLLHRGRPRAAHAPRGPTRRSSRRWPPPTRARSSSIVAGSAVLTESWRDAGAGAPAGLVLRHGRRATPSPTSLLGATSTPPAGCRSRCPPTPPTSRRSIATPTRSPTTAGTATGASPATATSRRSRSASGSPTRPGRSGPTTVDDDGTALDGDRRLTNTGDRPAPTCCRCTPDARPTPSRPARRLVAFQRVELAAGASTDVVLAIPWDRLARAEEGGWVLPAGTYALEVGRHSADVSSVDLVVDRARELGNGRTTTYGRERDRRVDPAGPHPTQALGGPPDHVVVAGSRRPPPATRAPPRPASRSRPRRSTRRTAASPLAIAIRSRTARTDMARSSRA